MTFVEEATQTLASDTMMMFFINDQSGLLPPTAKVLLSIQFLCHTLLDVVKVRIYDDSKASVPHQSLRQPTEIVDAILQRSGWEVEDIAQLPRDIVHRYYLSFYRRQDIRILRPRVTRTSTETKTMPSTFQSDDLPKLEPCHTSPGCQCETISPPGEEIEDAFANNRIVLVRFDRETSTMSVQTRSMESVAPSLETDCEEFEGGTLPFLAISHVRSAGLGSDRGYSLPYCQLAYLQDRAETDCTGTDRSERHFWIDCMCLPEDRLQRKIAAESIWQIFRAANAVLVLDPSLYRHHIWSSEEAVLRIQYSPWKSRLWTLEEGFYARRLLFRFDNVIKSLDDILEDLEASLATLKPRVLRIIQPGAILPAIEDEEDLRSSIFKLGNDIRLLMQDDTRTSPQAVKLPNSETDGDTRVAKHTMQQILRLAYLTSNKFRYFLDESERRLLPSLRAELKKVYTSVEHSDCLGANSSMESYKRRAKLRIQQMDDILLLQLRDDDASVCEAQKTGV